MTSCPYLLMNLILAAYSRALSAPLLISGLVLFSSIIRPLTFMHAHSQYIFLLTDKRVHVECHVDDIGQHPNGRRNSTLIIRRWCTTIIAITKVNSNSTWDGICPNIKFSYLKKLTEWIRQRPWQHNNKLHEIDYVTNTPTLYPSIELRWARYWQHHRCCCIH